MYTYIIPVYRITIRWFYEKLPESKMIHKTVFQESYKIVYNKLYYL